MVEPPRKLLPAARLRAQIVKELLSLLRDPRARLILVGPPLMQLLIFSFAATLEVRNATVAVLDRDGGRWAQELVAGIHAAGFVGRLLRPSDPGALHAAIGNRQALLALEIPPGFSQDVAAGRPAVVQVIVDGRRANAGQVALGYVEQVAARLGARLRGAPVAAEAAAVRHWFNPNLNYRWYVVPSLSGILSMMVAMLVTALSIAREREMGTFDQLLVSPCTPGEIIVAKAAPALLIGSLLGLVMVSAAAFGFGVPFTGSLGALVAVMLLFILANVGIGLTLSALCATQQQAILGTFATAVPMILMSGFATPVENMPQVLQWIAEAMPLKHFLVVVQGTFLKSLPAADLVANTWPLLAIGTVTLATATLLVRSRLQ